MPRSKLYNKIFDGRFKVLKVYTDINAVRLENIYNHDQIIVNYRTLLHNETANKYVRNHYRQYRIAIGKNNK